MRRTIAMIGAANQYSVLRLVSLSSCLSILLLTLFILLTYNSDSWFKYDAIDLTDGVLTINLNRTNDVSHKIEEGSFGLWHLCTRQFRQPEAKCVPWTNMIRPRAFGLLKILQTFALFFSNFTIFPCWLLFMLLAYNINNRFTRYITYLTWTQCIFTFVLAGTLITVLAITRSTKFHSDSREYDLENGKYIVYTSGNGMYLLITATIFSLAAVVLSLVTLAGKIYIDQQVAEAEEELLKQLSDDSFPITWQRPTLISRGTSPYETDQDEPPPYSISTGQRQR